MPRFVFFGLLPDYARRPKSQSRTVSNRDFSIIPIKFPMNIEHNHALYWKFGTVAVLKSDKNSSVCHATLPPFIFQTYESENFTLRIFVPI
jgi:hypothetical protein